jgi:hypothetical protein
MIDPDEKAPARQAPGQGRNETNCSNPIPAPAEAQVLIPDFNIDVHGFILIADEIKELERRREEARCEFMDRQWERVRDDCAKTHAELDAYQEKCRQRHRAEAARKKHRQEVADRLAEAQLELAKIEIQIAKARLAVLRKGGFRG